MANSKPKLGLGIAVAVLAIGGLVGVRMSGRAGGEGGGGPGCGGAEQGSAGGATAGTGMEQKALGTQLDPNDATWKPYVAAAVVKLGPALAAAHLTPANLKAVGGWYDGSGNTHINFVQVHNGLPVLGGDAQAQLAADVTVQDTKQQFVDASGLGPATAMPQEKAIHVATSELSCATCKESCAICLNDGMETVAAYQVVDGVLNYRVAAKGTGKAGEPLERSCLVQVDTGRSKCTVSIAGSDFKAIAMSQPAVATAIAKPPSEPTATAVAPAAIPLVPPAPPPGPAPPPPPQ